MNPNPFLNPYSSQNNHAWNIPRQPTIERYRNQINYMSHGGLNQSHFSYGDPPPPYGRGFQNYGFPAANFSPHQTARPRNPFVVPIFLQHPIARPINPVVLPPERLINPFVTTRPTNHVSTPPARQTNPAAISPAQRTNSVAISPTRLTNRAAGPRARPTNPVVAPRAGPIWCKICEVRISGPKTLEEHNKGKTHQNMLKKRERSEELRATRRREREQVPSAPVNSADRSKTVQKSERETNVERHKDYLGKFEVETSNIPAEKAKGEQKDNFVTRGYDSKRKLGETNGGSDDNQIKRIRRTTEASKDKGESRHNSVSEGNDSKWKFRGNDGSNHKSNIKQLRDIASSKPEGELRHKSVAEGHDSKLKSGGTSGGNDKKIKKRRRVIKSSKSGINSPSNCAAAESNVQVSTVAPPEQSMPMPLQVLLPEPNGETNGEPYDSKRKIGETNGGSDDNQIKQIRRTTEASKDKGESRHNSVSEGNDSKQKFRGNDDSNHKNNIKQLRDIASSKPEGELRHKSVAEGHDSKLKSGGTSGGNNKKIKKRRRVIKSSKSDINSPSNCAAAESNVQVSTVAPPEQSMPMPLQVLLPEPAVGSNSETQIQPLVLDKLEHQSSEAIVNHKSLSTTDETNVQPSSSMSMELDAPVNSSTNNEISNGNCKVEEKMEVLDISPLSNNVESTVQDPTAAPPQKPTPLRELSLSPLEGSNSEPVIQPFVQVELEHRVSEDNAHYESQNPTDEINVHLPSSISMEFDAPADSSTNTEISNENSIAEENMEVLTDLRISSIVQENVCFVCGNQGFLEALVHCNKCQISARHMYCLDGPVVFSEDVTWFCEDCDPTAVETFSNDKSACPPSRASDSLDLEDAIQTRMEETNFTRQVEERNKLKKECQATLKDTANSIVETVPVENSQGADLNLADSEDHVVAQPIDDPIWRGSLHLRNGSIVSISGLLAHLSDLACPRVSEKTRLFPEKLSMELLQRCAVWPNLFSKDGTDRDSIALYFFPDERSERDFYKLVDDIIHSDLAMRAVLEHVELLIFPSTTLPVEYRRINAKFYLWGVFKSNKSSSNTK